MKKLFIFIIIVGVILTLFGFWNYQRGGGFSKDVLKLEILGPEEATIATDIEYIVKYKNIGNFRLEEAKLLFECPSSSLECDLVEKEEFEEKGLQQKEIFLEDIYPGQEKILHFKTKLLGKGGEGKEAKAELTFKPKNLQAIYSVKTTSLTVIKEVPITFEFDLPSKIESGREVEFSLNYFSHLKEPLSDLRCLVDYPADFEFLESKPETAFSQNQWVIPLLGTLDGSRIKIKGKMNGEIGKGKIFKARLELWKDEEYILLKETEGVVEVIEPLIDISQRINDSVDYIAKPGEELYYEIFFRNIGKSPFEKQFLTVELTGDVFDFSTLNLPLGEYKPEKNLIIWGWQRVPYLKYLEPGEEGKVEFSIKLKEVFTTQENGGAIVAKVDIPPIHEEFETKIKSHLEILQRGFFEDEIFGNSGPIPPRVGQITTYTILWQATNCCNKVKNIKVLGKLPAQVMLTGQFFPEEETSKFFFDSESREISWQIGELVSNQTKTLAFQISFSPTVFQRGKTPNIVEEAQIIGDDEWTGENLQGFSPAINTTLPDDNTITEEQGIVQ